MLKKDGLPKEWHGDREVARAPHQSKEKRTAEELRARRPRIAPQIPGKAAPGGKCAPGTSRTGQKSPAPCGLESQIPKNPNPRIEERRSSQPANRKMQMILNEEESPRRGSNSRPLPYQGSALPLSYVGVAQARCRETCRSQAKPIVGNRFMSSVRTFRDGTEPSTRSELCVPSDSLPRFQDRFAWKEAALPQEAALPKRPSDPEGPNRMERETGLEPATLSLEG